MNACCRFRTRSIGLIEHGAREWGMTVGDGHPRFARAVLDGPIERVRNRQQAYLGRPSLRRRGCRRRRHRPAVSVVDLRPAGERDACGRRRGGPRGAVATKALGSMPQRARRKRSPLLAPVRDRARGRARALRAVRPLRQARRARRAARWRSAVACSKLPRPSTAPPRLPPAAMTQAARRRLRPWLPLEFPSARLLPKTSVAEACPLPKYLPSPGPLSPASLRPPELPRR